MVSKARQARRRTGESPAVVEVGRDPKPELQERTNRRINLNKIKITPRDRAFNISPRRGETSWEWQLPNGDRVPGRTGE
jgi:hypothetical protein